MLEFLISHLPKFQLLTEFNMENVAMIFILAFLSACLEISFQIYMDRDMILEFYGNFLRWLSKKKLKKISYVLGGCIYCNGFWISVVIFYLYFGHFSLGTFLFTGLNAVFLRVMVMMDIND